MSAPSDDWRQRFWTCPDGSFVVARRVGRTDKIMVTFNTHQLLTEEQFAAFQNDHPEDPHRTSHIPEASNDDAELDCPGPPRHIWTNKGLDERDGQMVTVNVCRQCGAERTYPFHLPRLPRKP